MSIVRMKKLRLIALRRDRDELLTSLQHIGCVEVTESAARLDDSEWAALVKKDGGEAGRYKTKINQMNTALDALGKYAQCKTGLFIKRFPMGEDDFFSADAAVSAEASAEAINNALRTISQIQSQENRINGQKASLLPWASLELPLETERIGSVRVLFATAPAAADVADIQEQVVDTDYPAQLYSISDDNELHYMLLLAHQSCVEELQIVLRPSGFGVQRPKGFIGTAAANLTALEEKLSQLAEEKQQAIEKIVAQAPMVEKLRVYLDRLEQEMTRQTTCERLLTDGTVVFLEGWVAETGRAQVEQLLTETTCGWEMSDPGPDDKVPTLLKNNALVRPLNMVTEMYSLPAYHGIDPNPLIFGFYIFFFGMMFADIGYGLIIFGACLWLKLTYHPKGTMGYIAGLGILCGITTTICGVLTGSLFGDAVTVIAENFMGGKVASLWSVVNPLQDPMTILYFGIALGAVHMLFGQCIHIYMGFRDGNGLDGLLDVVPWWIFFAGCAYAFLVGGSWLLLTGVAVLVLTQGRHKKGFFGKLFGGIVSLYDVTSWLGDILSYARLMALMLASAVIASVVNILGALAGIVLVFIPIFLVGHLFNLGINVIGTYVHAARLQYLEFFSKFYIEGGIPFQPLCYDTKYVDLLDANGEVI